MICKASITTIDRSECGEFWIAVASLPEHGMSRKLRFPQLSKAVEWVESQEFHVPSLDEVTSNGRYSCE
jgi:hypothetical protein